MYMLASCWLSNIMQTSKASLPLPPEHSAHMKLIMGPVYR